MQNNDLKTIKTKRKFTGIVVSDKMDKTIVVRVMNFVKDSKYKKISKSYNKYKVHDEKNKAKVGDTVVIIEARPISKDKRWRLVEVLVEAKAT
jgi:small subunit ribosomal protein S17